MPPYPWHKLLEKVSFCFGTVSPWHNLNTSFLHKMVKIAAIRFRSVFATEVHENAFAAGAWRRMALEKFTQTASSDP